MTKKELEQNIKARKEVVSILEDMVSREKDTLKQQLLEYFHLKYPDQDVLLGRSSYRMLGIVLRDGEIYARLLKYSHGFGSTITDTEYLLPTKRDDKFRFQFLTESE